MCGGGDEVQKEVVGPMENREDFTTPKHSNPCVKEHVRQKWNKEVSEKPAA